MKVGPLDLPVSNANQFLCFVLLVVLTIYGVRKAMAYAPASLAPFKP